MGKNIEIKVKRQKGLHLRNLLPPANSRDTGQTCLSLHIRLLSLVKSSIQWASIRIILPSDQQSTANVRIFQLSFQDQKGAIWVC